MKIKVIMSDKAMSRETMDARERMLKAALSSDAPKIMLIVFLWTVSKKARMNWTVIQTKLLRQRKW